MLAGLVVGTVLGVLAHVVARPVATALATFVRYVTEPVGTLFLRLLFMLVIPLIVSALALGVAGLGDIRRLGRIGLKTLAYTVVVVEDRRAARRRAREPGAAGRRPVARAEGRLLRARAPPSAGAAARAGDTGVDFLVKLVPANLVRAMADGDMLAVMVFSLFLGIGLALTRTDAAAPLRGGARRASTTW